MVDMYVTVYDEDLDVNRYRAHPHIPPLTDSMKYFHRVLPNTLFWD